MPSANTNGGDALSSWSLQEIAASRESIDAFSKVGVSLESGERFDTDAGLSESIAACFQDLNDDRKRGNPSEWGASLIGVRLERYEVVEAIGFGGFGIVVRAFDVELQRDVALKLPRPELLACPEMGLRFLEEARVAAALRHPGIVQVHDVGAIGPVTYIASELCQGTNLYDWLSDRSQPLPPPLAARLLSELADAVGYAHTRGTIHQDLKPANILVEGAKDAAASTDLLAFRVTDFGLACRLPVDGRIDAQQIGGTRRYMAPEQRAEDASLIGTHTDVYALGLILSDLLTSPSRPDVFLQHSAGDLAGSATCTPSSLKPKQVPADLWAILSKCLEESPECRYRTGYDLRDDLLRFLRGEQVVARPLGYFERAHRWMRRRPLAASLAAGLVLTLFLSAIGANVMYLRERGLRRAADLRRQEARRAVDEMYTQVAERWLVSDGTLDVQQRAFLLKALAYYEQWASDDQSDSQRQHEASIAWHRVANMHSRLGNTKAAALARQRCLAILEQLLQREPTNRTYRYDHFYNLLVLGPESLALSNGRNESEYNRCGLQAYEEISVLAAEEPGNAIYKDALAAAARRAGAVAWNLGKTAEGREAFLVALDMGRKLVASHPNDPTYLGNVAESLRMLRQASKSLDEVDQSLAYGHEGVTIYRQLSLQFPQETSHREFLGEELAALAALQTARREYSLAHPLFDQALAVQDQLCADFPQRSSFVFQRIRTHYELGRLEFAEEHAREAERLVGLAIAEATKLLQENPDNRGYQLMLHEFLTSSPIESLRDQSRADRIAESWQVQQRR